MNFEDFKFYGDIQYINSDKKYVKVKMVFRGLRLYEVKDYDFNPLLTIMSVKDKKTKIFGFYPFKIKILDMKERGNIIFTLSYDYMQTFYDYISQKMSLRNAKSAQEIYYYGIYSVVNKQCYVHPFSIQFQIDDTVVCESNNMCGYLNYETTNYITKLDEKIDRILNQVKKLEKIL